MTNERDKERCRVVVFAKAPNPGEVKTRLLPLLGAETVTSLYRRLIRHALKTAAGANLGKVELWCSPTAEHPFFIRCAEEYKVALREQPDGDLGVRMHYAIASSIMRADHVIIIGADCPNMTTSALSQTDEWLRVGYDAVLGPAEDGGYVLLGVKRASWKLFDGVGWGSSQVLAQTRERLELLNWRSRELPLHWDVDRPEDYRRLVIEELLTSLPLDRPDR